METTTVPIGTLIGVYRVEALIGTGGMGSVYRGVHARLGRKAAIKVLSDSMASDPVYVSRFFHEAKIVAEVGHPNIVEVLDFFESDSPRRVAYMMELVDGPSLSTVVRRNKLTSVQVLNIAIQLLEALEAVHRMDVVHRDLKPDNILVVGPLDTDMSARPCIKVLDFGIAKIQRESTQHKTNTGILLGTPAYMAPEQVAGEPVSKATDVYAVGEIVYEMLTGKRLFDGESRAVLRAKVNEVGPNFELPNDLPDRHHFITIIRACLAPEQKHRPTTGQLLDTMRAMLGDEPLKTPSFARHSSQPAPYQPTLSGVMNTSQLRVPRSAAMTMAIAGVIMLLVSAIVVAVMLRPPEPVVVEELIKEPPAPPPAPPPIVEPPPPVQAIEPPPAPPPPIAKPVKKAVKKEEGGPLKKGEFPTW